MEEGAILNAEIDIRSSFSPFDIPKLVEVIKAIEQQLPEDRLKVVKQMRGPLIGLYKITSNDYTLYEGKSITIRNVVLPITLRRKQSRSDNERKGTLITIYDAFTGSAQQIPGTVFGELFMGIEGVKFIKQTTPQFHKGTRILDGNRFLVLDFDTETVDIGETLRIESFQFRINFWGQKRFCYLCQTKHGVTCPEKTKFKLMAEARAGKLTHKMYGDSHLRHVNQLALAANVACTSGGGIGQIVNSIHPDPEKVDDIVIVAGDNDIHGTDDLREFHHIVTKTAEKIHALTATKKVTLALPSAPRETPAEKAKYDFLKEVVTGVRSLHVLEMPGIEYGTDNHPTEVGTKTIIGTVEEHLEAQIILEPDYVTTDRMYSQVQACFKVGCRSCASRVYTTTICEACKLASQSADITRLEELLTQRTEEDFPSRENDIDMGEINKRMNKDGNDDGKSKKPKLNDDAT